MAYNDISDGAMNYITLNQFINDFVITMDSDDYANNASDTIIRNIALRGIREIGFDLGKRIKSLKIPVNSSNNTVPLPDDFVDIIKLGVVGSDGLVRVLRENKNINFSFAYSLGADGNTTTSTSDSEDGPLSIDQNLILNREESKTPTGGAADSAIEEVNSFNSFIFRNYIYDNNVGGLYGIGGGQGEGEYRMNLDQNRIELELNSDISNVVIEYISDEARSTNPVVHVYAEEALRAYVYYKIVERKSSVPYNEKSRARAEFYNERRKARIRMSNFTKEEALKTIRKNYKQSPKY